MIAPPLTDGQKAAVLRDLIAQPNMRAAMGTVALRNDVTVAQVAEMVKRCGWPDKAKMGRALEALGEEPDAAEDDEDVHGSRDDHVAELKQFAQARGFEYVDVSSLLERGKRGTRHVRGLAERIERDIALLRTKVAAEDDRDKARQEVARLQRLLAKAKEKARGHPTPGYEYLQDHNAGRFEREREVCGRHGTTREGIRRWAIGEGLDVSRQGLLPRCVVDAFDAAHTTAEEATG